MHNKEAKKQIVFVNQSSGYLMIDIIHAHLETYDEISLFTGFLNPRNNQLDPRVKVHMLTTYDRSSTLKRLFTWMLFSIKTFFLLRFKYPQAHVYFVSNPPFVVFIANWIKNKCTFLIYDVYPDVLVQYGLLKPNALLVRVWKKINKEVFKKAGKVYTIGHGMKKLLVEYVPKSKLAIIPIWSDNAFLKPIKRSQNPFVAENRLSNKFTIMYSGNIGKTHPVEILLELADKLKKYPVEVLIIGEGEKKKRLEEEVLSKRLSNVRFLPFQSNDMFPKSLAAASLSVVTLGQEAAQLSVPSKTYNIMSVKVPILAIASKDSELSKIIEQHQNGACFEPNQLNEIVMFVKQLLENVELYNDLAKNSLLASENYTPSNAKKLLFVN